MVFSFILILFARKSYNSIIFISLRHKNLIFYIIIRPFFYCVLYKIVKKQELNEFVTLHGFQGKEYIDKILNKSSIYLMTSYTESFGIVLIEAMSHGVPCVAFDSAEGAREIIQSGNNGYLVKNRNFDAYKLKVKSLIEKKEERIRIGKLARESVNKYTSDKVGSEWISLIEESGVYE